MSSRISFVQRVLSSVVLTASLIVSTSASAQSQERREQLADFANKALASSFCMGDVCLGMSLADVIALPGRSVEHEYNKWERNCTADLTKSNGLYYISVDGTQFNVSFRDMPGAGDTQQRARVGGISLYHAATRRELDELIEPLLNRWIVSPAEDTGELGFDHWTRPTEFFTLHFRVSHEQPPRRSLMSLSATLPDYRDMLRGQTACAGVNTVPKL
ncbi:hypothetical protein [Luteimonas sp. MC1750]|uniref:hypothetical protein n=1 Tax=Luteimonas sp. MC1750 TaxID=2799326 RepID=UPI0018F0DEE2|nr:hypothetical protein [Luteimonas sp. MC1750]MBJ6983964.1 hypothetical protein [Luteimonas sp. MC1750]QQO06777.1 hypothetical protein JGR68_04960 [Luteimonas sp. MC1750]